MPENVKVCMTISAADAELLARACGLLPDEGDEMINNNEVNALRLMMPEYLARYRGYNMKLSNGYYTMIECQICGLVDNKPSAQYFHDSGRALCYHTRKSFDIFDLIGDDFGLSRFGDKVRKAKELFSGEQLHDAAELHQRKLAKVPDADARPREKKDYTKLCYAGWKCLYLGSDYLEARGIRHATAKKNKVGYLPRFRSQQDQDGTPAVIFPHMRAGKVEGCAVRFLHPTATRWLHLGNYPFYKAGAGNGPVYIVEGEMDALSIAECGGRAVSIGGTSGVDRLLQELAVAQSGKKEMPFFLCWLDADAPGALAQRKLLHGLRELGLDARAAELRKGGEWKDANECLLAARPKLADYIKKFR